MGRPVRRRHAPRPDAGLEASGCWDTAGGTLLHPWGGSGRDRRSTDVLGSGCCWGGDITVLIDEAHATDIG